MPTRLLIAIVLLLLALPAAQNRSPPAVRLLASFEGGTIAPFAASAPDAASITAEHATEGRSALRLASGYAAWDGLQDWTGYDFLEADVFNTGTAPATLSVEIRDTATKDYWTRVNYTTAAPPGASKLIVPTDIYVGEKSRPGRPLDKAHVTRLVLILGGKQPAFIFDNLRLERDLSDRVKVPGLRAFSFGPGTSPPLRGFTAVTPASTYTPERGYGLVNANITKAYDALQPDPLYEVGIAIQSGSFRVDLPNGRYHVFLNLDFPSGFWGEYQIYRRRTVRANGAVVADDTMDLPRFVRQYFRFADVDDSLDENTFDKYQVPYFHEKQFDAEVADGKLVLDFEGSGWANFVSALVIYPADEASAGQRYLANLRERRRFYFDNYFKRVAPDGRKDSRGAIPPFVPTASEKTAGFALFTRDWMEDVPVNGVPRREEAGRPIDTFASAGELAPLVFSLYPVGRGGEATVAATELRTPDGATIPASAISAGVVSHRITRVTTEGTVYTIAPRFILPKASAQIRPGTTTTFWLTLHTPEHVKAGDYRGSLSVRFGDGRTGLVPLRVRVFATPLRPLDVGAGPWGSSISLPWFAEELGDYDREMFRKSLARMREYGCTSFSGIPTLRITGWQGGKPMIDFARADREMEDARDAGFRDIVVNYNGGIGGFDNYHIDTAAMRAAGYSDYVAFLRAILGAVHAHARAQNWLPVAYNLCDEPIDNEVKAAIANARAWREAAPQGMLTTGATSVQGASQSEEPHLELAKTLRAPSLNGHDAAAVEAIRAAGDRWAFYNGGNRWTFGAYMYK
ncbi:MAG TPA: hypothetical protein VKT77_14155, partial [Chthonomonadaceae bacterium]|nr:hypothetical protein [Chthonomonadaceae bacterium]